MPTFVFLWDFINKVCLCVDRLERVQFHAHSHTARWRREYAVSHECWGFGQHSPSECNRANSSAHGSRWRFRDNLPPLGWTHLLLCVCTCRPITILLCCSCWLERTYMQPTITNRHHCILQRPADKLPFLVFFLTMELTRMHWMTISTMVRCFSLLCVVYSHCICTRSIACWCLLWTSCCSEDSPRGVKYCSQCCEHEVSLRRYFISDGCLIGFVIQRTNASPHVGRTR